MYPLPNSNDCLIKVQIPDERSGFGLMNLVFNEYNKNNYCQYLNFIFLPVIGCQCLHNCF